MKQDWVKHCLRLSRKEADLWSGCRKIFRGVTLSFDWNDTPVELKDAGYTKYKMTLLLKQYNHEDSRKTARDLWEGRKKQAKYGSVGFHCYNHLIKGHSHTAYGNRINERQYKKSTRASVMGPCIQAVNVTWIKKGEVGIDVFYRTTELFKKFPADLIMLKEHLLADFNFEDCEVTQFRCHFANITCHPMYFVTLLPSIIDPIAELEAIKKADKRMFDWIVKWTARYIIPEYHRGIAKFAQAQRVKMDALARLKGKDLKRFQKYLRDNHPGHRNNYVDPQEITDAED